jgi:hypothetical protein
VRYTFDRDKNRIKKDFLTFLSHNHDIIGKFFAIVYQLIAMQGRDARGHFNLPIVAEGAMAEVDVGWLGRHRVPEPWLPLGHIST